MGKSETASASIGIKILLSDLILQINEISLGHDEDNDELPQTYNEFKDYITEQFKTHGSYYKSKFSSKVEPDLHDGTLFERYLLVPVKDILETERWGYERYGVNSASRPLDFDLSVVELNQDIKNFSVVFFIKQHSG